MSQRLLTRDEFRETVLARLAGRCCVPGCDRSATDAHHLLNRNLFKAAHEFGGYFAANGAGLCDSHHLDAEETRLSVEDLRSWCGITAPVLPEHLADDTGYDTWGNPVLPDNTRLPGELFYTEQCQKALRGVRHLFPSPYVKYPRTLHLPWSPGLTSDDRVQPDLSLLTSADRVVMTEKQDGEATTIYFDGHSHARSLTASSHPSRDHVRALAAHIGHQLPHGWRVCGENLAATHSIRYTNLPAFFQVYSIWDGERCLPWPETVEWCELLDLTPVPVLYIGPMLTEREFNDRWQDITHGRDSEGYVVRTTDGFTLREFQRSVLKYVRANHVRSESHWAHQETKWNSLAQ